MAPRTKRYRVLNPRDIPAGIRVLSFRGKGPGGADVEAFEGDMLDLTVDEVSVYQERGFLEEVTGG